jgi:hypothetical protein
MLLAACSSSPNHSSDHTSTRSPSPTIEAVPLRSEAARQLEVQVRSGNTKQVRRAFAVPSSQRFAGDFTANLAALKTFQIDNTRFVQIDNVTAKVPITTTDAAGKATTWTATLVLIKGQWKIGMTQEQGQL